jgi:hypothetical protein
MIVVASIVRDGDCVFANRQLSGGPESAAALAEDVAR